MILCVIFGDVYQIYWPLSYSFRSLVITYLLRKYLHTFSSQSCWSQYYNTKYIKRTKTWEKQPRHQRGTEAQEIFNISFIKWLEISFQLMAFQGEVRWVAGEKLCKIWFNQFWERNFIIKVKVEIKRNNFVKKCMNYKDFSTRATLSMKSKATTC